MTDSVRRYAYKVGAIVLGGQETINLDPVARQQFEATIHVDLVDGTMSVQTEYTMDNTADLDPSKIRWHPLSDTLTGTTLAKLAIAVTAVRLRIDSITGEIRLSVLQGIGR